MVTYLGSQVKSEIAASGKAVLNQQRNLVGEAKLYGLGETCSLAEVDEVLEGKC